MSVRRQHAVGRPRSRSSYGSALNLAREGERTLRSLLRLHNEGSSDQMSDADYERIRETILARVYPRSCRVLWDITQVQLQNFENP